MDGRTLDTEGEKQKVIRCLEAAIERRAAQVNYNCICLYNLLCLIKRIETLQMSGKAGMHELVRLLNSYKCLLCKRKANAAHKHRL